jgi:large subunit ribosomal protein L3
MTRFDGKKLKMSQIFEESGLVRSGTFVQLLSDFTDELEAATEVRLSGTSKGRGFAGVVKKFHFKGGPATHGQSDRERHRGSSGQTTTPGRVYKGKRMAGHMGNARVTLRRVPVLQKDREKKLIFLGCPVPGAFGSKVVIEVMN